ncbi:MAG: DUF1330 domain-containing protein [Pseudomonadota bacterium]
MTDEHYVDPGRELFTAFKDLPRDTPINMINMLRFREHAAYPDDHPRVAEGLSGAEAYAHYGKESAPIFQRVGGSIIWRGAFETMLIGPNEERWDAVFIARYPAAAAFLEMVTDPDYRNAVVNRQAAVATSRLIRCGEMPDGLSADGAFA